MECTMTIRKLSKIVEGIEPSKWRAYGVEQCTKCGELEVANSYFFPGAFERKKLIEKPICRYCGGVVSWPKKR